MYNLPHDLIDALKATPEALAALLDGVSQSQAASARGGDEDWSVVEVICHLRDAEEISLGRVQTIRDRDHPKIARYDQLVLARERNYRAADPYAALEAFRGFRERHAAI